MDDFKHIVQEEIKGLRWKGVLIDMKRSSLAEEEIKRRFIFKTELVIAVKGPWKPEERMKAWTIA